MRKLKLLRFSMRRVDYALIVLLIIGGLGGYDGFPKFLTLAQTSTNPLGPWILFFVALSFVLLLKITSRTFFSPTASAFAALVIQAIVTALILVLCLAFRGSAILDDLAALALVTASATSFLLMAVQDWFQPRVDLLAIEKIRSEMSGIVGALRSANIDDGQRLRLQSLVGSLPTKINEALASGVLTSVEITTLTDLRAQIANLAGALTGPVQNWPEALRALDTSRIETELSL